MKIPNTYLFQFRLVYLLQNLMQKTRSKRDVYFMKYYFTFQVRKIRMYTFWRILNNVSVLCNYFILFDVKNIF